MKRAWVYRLPESNELVGQYRVVGPLGQGGQGHVLLAEWEGRSYVLKFFRSLPVSHSGELELDILRHLEHPNVVRVLGHGRWPSPEEGYFYLVMEYVQGRTLLGHALEHNPSARGGATLMLEAARALALVHRQGVLHRDIKPDNLMVRAADGTPVWVDFGVGHLEGRATLPRMRRLPPGTPEYTSPEAYRFLREHPEAEARYQPGVADEVWAFGVTLYELLTDTLPFGSRMSNEQLVEDIRTRRPEAPHERNPLVPVALSRVCLRMLEKDPGGRLADMDAVAGALEAALAEAGADWDVPMMDPDAPQVRTTQEIPGKVVDRDTWERFKQQVKAVMPRRGRARRKARQEPPSEAAAMALLEEEAREGSFEALAEAVEARLYEPALPVAARKAAAPGPAAAARHDAGVGYGAVAAVSPARGRGLGWPARAAAVAVVLLLVLAGTWALHSRLESGEARPPASAPPEVPSPAGWWASHPTLHPALVREVAAPGEPSQSGGGAAAFLDSSPASTFATMLRENDTRPKSDEKPAPRPRRAAPRCVPTTLETCVVGLCSVLLTGCTSTPQVVRPPPRPADCPPGAVKAMKELGIEIGDEGVGSFRFEAGLEPITVRESSPMKVGYGLKNLGGFALTGRLYFGPERVYGRFTQATWTRDGTTYPVCVELGDPNGFDPWKPGVEREDVGGPADSAVIIPTQDIRAVERFE